MSSSVNSGKTRSNLEELQRIMGFLDFDPVAQQLNPKNPPHTWYRIKEVFRSRDKNPIRDKKALAEYLRMSRPTLNNNINIAHTLTLKKEAPKSTEPSWYKRFYSTETFALFCQHFPNPDLTSAEARAKAPPQQRYDPRKRNTMSYIRVAWHLKNEREPLKFTLQDFNSFFGVDCEIVPEFLDPETHTTEYGKAVALRWCMKNNLYPQVKDMMVSEDPRYAPVKRAKGKRKMWFLEEIDVQNLINVIDDPVLLMAEYTGILSGVRGNTLLRLHFSDIHPHQYRDGSGMVHFFETKTKDTTGGDADKPFFNFCIDFLLRYANDFNRVNKKMFDFNLAYLNDKLSSYAESAGIEKREPTKDGAEGKKIAITSHINKHTCATLMLKHMMELDSVSTYTHTDPKTLMDFYSGATEAKMIDQVLDLPRTGKTWKQLVKEFHAQFVAKYEYLMKLRAQAGGVAA